MNVTAAAEHPGELDPRIDPGLAPLVARTRGLQPWRRAFHAGNGLLLAFLPQQVGMERTVLLAVLAGVFVALLVLDLVRLRSTRVNRVFFSVFPALASPREAIGVASSTWYAGGVLLVYALFPPAVAVPAILVLGLADPAAAVVGRTWGRRRFGTGTVVGSTTFACVAAVVMAAFVSPWVALVAGMVGAVAEAIPWRVDDNLVVPLAVGSTMALLGG